MINKQDTMVDVLGVLDAFPFYVMLVDEDHYIIEANRAVYMYLGVKREDVLGKYCPKVIHNLDHPFPGCPLEDSAATNRALERELKDPVSGNWLLSAIYPTRIVTAKGNRVFLHMVTDITERKQAQEQLKISHQQLQQLSAHLENVREEEKRKIARDLHDDTSQLLASLYAHMEAAIETLPHDIHKAESLLRKAQTLSTSVLDEVHNLIYELRPSLLDEMGLVQAIKSLVENTAKDSRVAVTFRDTGTLRRLSPQVEIVLFRVVQEALTNILKHSGATRAAIWLSFKKSGLKVTVKDNGIGFEDVKVFGSGKQLRGMGLLGMRERVELIHGSLDIKSTPGKGTQITVEVSYDAQEKPGEQIINDK